MFASTCTSTPQPSFASDQLFTRISRLRQSETCPASEPGPSLTYESSDLMMMSILQNYKNTCTHSHELNKNVGSLPGALQAGCDVHHCRRSRTRSPPAPRSLLDCSRAQCWSQICELRARDRRSGVVSHCRCVMRVGGQAWEQILPTICCA